MTQKLNVIVIEDEKNICNFIQTTLENHDYKVTTAATGKEGLSCITSCYPDVVLLDLGLPDIDGLEVLRQVRDFSTVPVIVISARIQETEKVAALDAGADDYITKPFGTSELLARIRTALRHSQASAPGKTEAVYRSGDLMIDFDKRLVTIAGQEIHLTQIEYKLVSLLAQNAGKVLTYDYIINHIWGPYADSNNQILRVNMAHIRRKMGENPAEPKYINTEIGVGYRMREE
ncbi:MAG TPA: response regulator transcription factor [Candidatus Lachnoclostridium stercoravium]|uniref:Stage 0 sporulation protein A homolog n=1 Tax=Candidatus Lachnoclostridium stercoravium TaxID=2838633 RepID=A0A9D2KNC0_9FIRM|nr:response regulator transcription factor [Candidatus Lachnoclostridium stercoravium]